VSWVSVWLLLALLATCVVLVFAISLGRHAVIVGRTARRFREEVGPVASEVSREGGETAERAGSLEIPDRTGRP
jgi:Sec-independent protein translocase protein TatA